MMLVMMIAVMVMEEMMRLLNTSIHNLADYSPQEYRG